MIIITMNTPNSLHVFSHNVQMQDILQRYIINVIYFIKIKIGTCIYIYIYILNYAQ